MLHTHLFYPLGHGISIVPVLAVKRPKAQHFQGHRVMKHPRLRWLPLLWRWSSGLREIRGRRPWRRCAVQAFCGGNIIDSRTSWLNRVFVFGLGNGWDQGLEDSRLEGAKLCAHAERGRWLQPSKKGRPAGLRSSICHGKIWRSGVAHGHRRGSLLGICTCVHRGTGGRAHCVSLIFFRSGGAAGERRRRWRGRSRGRQLALLGLFFPRHEPALELQKYGSG